MEYSYDDADASPNDGVYDEGMRLEHVRYPDGRLVHYTYGAGGSVADDLSRVDAVRRMWPFLRDRRVDAYQPMTERYLDR